MKVLVKETNQYLYFSPGTKVSLQINNSIFEDHGSYSFPFDLPLDQNRRALNFPDRISMAKINKTVPAYFQIGNNQFNANILILSVANAIRISLLFSDSFFNSTVREKSLTDLVFDDILLGYADTDIIDYLNAGCTLNYPDRAFAVFPFSSNGQHRFNRYIWGMDPTYIYSFENIIGTVPFFYLNYILENIFRKDNRLVINQLKNDAELNTLTLFNVFNGFPYNSDPAGIKINAADYMPNVKLKDLFTGLTATFNVRYYKSMFANEVSIYLFKNLLSQMYSEDLTQFLYSGADLDYSSIITGIELGPQFSPNCAYYKERVKDISAKKFIGTTNNPPDPDDRNKDFVVQDASWRGDFYLSDGEQWNFYSLNIQKKSVGDSSEKYGPQIPPVLSKVWQDETAPDNIINYFAPYYMPESWDKDQSLMLCFYRGMHAKPGFDEDVPYGAGNIYMDNIGTEFPDVKYSLQNDGEKGLHKQFWESYFNWKMNTLTSTVNLRMTFNKLKSLDLSHKFRIDRVDYFIKNMRFELRIEDDAISRVQTTLYKA